MKIFPIESDDKRVERICSILEGLTKSATNAVIFEDVPLVWFQIFLGLYLEKPTFIMIKKMDLNSATAWMLDRPNVRKVVVDDFDEKAMVQFTKQIELWVKK